MKLNKILVVLAAAAMLFPGLCLAEGDYQNPSGNYNYNYNYNRPFNWNYSNTQMFINHNWPGNRAPIITYQPPKTNINVDRTIDSLNKFVIIPNPNTMGTGAFAGTTNSAAIAQKPEALSSQEIILNNTIPGTGSSSDISASLQSQAAYKIEDVMVK